MTCTTKHRPTTTKETEKNPLLVFGIPRLREIPKGWFIKPMNNSYIMLYLSTIHHGKATFISTDHHILRRNSGDRHGSPRIATTLGWVGLGTRLRKGPGGQVIICLG